MFPALHRTDPEIQIDFHDGLAFLCSSTMPTTAGAGPQSAKLWMHVGGAVLGCWPLDMGFTPFIGGAPSLDVFVDNMNAIKVAHDIAFLIPQMWIPMVNPAGMGSINLLFLIPFVMSSAKVGLGGGTVLVNNQPIGVGPAPVITCNDPIPLPTGIFLCVPRTVIVGLTLGDVLAFVQMFAIDVALAVAMLVVSKAGEKAFGLAKKGVSKGASKTVGAAKSFKAAFKAARANEAGYGKAIGRGFKGVGSDLADDLGSKLSGCKAVRYMKAFRGGFGDALEDEAGRLGAVGRGFKSMGGEMAEDAGAAVRQRAGAARDAALAALKRHRDNLTMPFRKFGKASRAGFKKSLSAWKAIRREGLENWLKPRPGRIKSLLTLKEFRSKIAKVWREFRADRAVRKAEKKAAEEARAEARKAKAQLRDAEWNVKDSNSRVSKLEGELSERQRAKISADNDFRQKKLAADDYERVKCKSAGDAKTRADAEVPKSRQAVADAQKAAGDARAAYQAKLARKAEVDSEVRRLSAKESRTAGEQADLDDLLKEQESLGAELPGSKAAADEAEAKASEAAAGYQDALHRQETAQKDLEAAHKRLEELKAEAEAAGKKDEDAWTALEDARKNLDEAKRQADEYEKAWKKLKEASDQAEDEAKRAEFAADADLDSTSKDLEEAKKKREKARKAAEEASERRQKGENDFRDAENELPKREKAVADAEAAESELASKETEAARAVEDLEARSEDLEGDRTAASRRVEELEAIPESERTREQKFDLAEAKDDLAGLEEECAEAAEELDQARKAQSQALEDRTRASKDVERARKDLEDFRKKIDRLGKTLGELDEAAEKAGQKLDEAEKAYAKALDEFQYMYESEAFSGAWTQMEKKACEKIMQEYVNKIGFKYVAVLGLKVVLKLLLFALKTGGKIAGKAVGYVLKGNTVFFVVGDRELAIPEAMMPAFLKKNEKGMEVPDVPTLEDQQANWDPEEETWLSETVLGKVDPEVWNGVLEALITFLAGQTFAEDGPEGEGWKSGFEKFSNEHLSNFTPEQKAYFGNLLNAALVFGPSVFDFLDPGGMPICLYEAGVPLCAMKLSVMAMFGDEVGTTVWDEMEDAEGFGEYFDALMDGPMEDALERLAKAVDAEADPAELGPEDWCALGVPKTMVPYVMNFRKPASDSGAGDGGPGDEVSGGGGAEGAVGSSGALSPGDYHGVLSKGYGARRS